MSKGAVNFSLFAGYYGQSSINSSVFQTLVRAIGESRSKLEEDRLMKREVKLLKEKIGKPNINPKQMREYLVRLIYCEMLGHEVSFGYIHALQFAQQPGLLEKRTGYLAISLFLHENHEFIMLLVNSLQKDLKSTNILEVCTALTVICKLIGPDMIAALLDEVLKLLTHDREIVRQKAVMVVYRFYVKAPSLIPNIKEIARRALCDRDPGVVAAVLNLFKHLIQEDASKYKDLVPSFVAVLKQIVENKFSREFEYNETTAPWMSICLLQILALLGKDDHRSSECMYEILAQAMSGAAEKTIACAVLYECLKAVATIYPSQALIQLAMKRTTHFLTHSVHDIKYLGINTMAALLRVQPDYVVNAEVQNVIIDCLNDEDETLKRKTLDLLCQITSAKNVIAVCDRLISFLRSTTDTFFREGLVVKITEIAEKFAPTTSWYLSTMNEVFEMGGALVKEEIAHNLMRLIAEGLDDEEEDAQLRHNAVSSYVGLSYKPSLPDVLIKLICWVVSEYAYVASEFEPGEILESVCGLLDRRFEDSQTCCWVIYAIGKLVSQLGYLPDSVAELLAKQCRTVSVDVRQRCHEILTLSNNIALMRDVFPLDASCEELEVDGSLSFLDDLVADSLRGGMAPYKPKSKRPQKVERIDEIPSPKLRFEAYEKPALPVPRQHQVSPTIPIPSTAPPFLTGPSTSGSPSSSSYQETSTPQERRDTPPSDNLPMQLNTKGKVWSKEGYRGREKLSTSAGSFSNTEEQTTINRYKPQEERRSYDKEEPRPPPELSMEEISKRNLKQALFGETSSTDAMFAGKMKQSVARGRRHDRQNHPPKSRSHSDKSSATSTASSGSENSPSDALATSRSRAQQTPLIDPLPVSERVMTTNAQECHPPAGTSMHEDLLLLDLSSPVSPTENKDIPSEASLLDGTTTPVENVVNGGDQHGVTIDTSNTQTKIDASPPVSLLDTDILETESPGLLKSTTTTLSAELTQFPHSKTQEEVCNDGTLRVTVQRVWKPRELVLALFITNQTRQETITEVSLKIELSSNLALVNPDQASISQENLHSSETIIRLVEVKLKSPSLNTRLNGKASYKNSTRTLKRTFLQSHTINISDFLRPLKLTTDEFGKKWTSTSNDEKDKVKSSVTSCEEVMENVTSSLNLHLVQIIGAEGIAVGTVLQNELCLLHGKVDNGTVALRVKSNSQLLSKVVLKQALSVFKL